MAEWLRQSTAVTKKMGPFLDEDDGKTTEELLTISQADIRMSKNGGAFAQTNNAAGGTHDENGYFGIPFDTTDTATLGSLLVGIHEAGALPVWQEYMVVPANVWDAMFGADKLQTHTVEMTAGVITAAVIATDAVDADAMAADGSVQIAAAVADRVLTGATHNINNSLGRRIRELADANILATGTAQAGTADSITLAAGSSALDDFYEHSDIVIIGGTGAGQSGRKCGPYNGTTKVATVLIPWIVTPDNTSEYEIARGTDSHVSEIHNGVITAATLAAEVVPLLYQGPHGPGVYLDDAAGNTDTDVGVDGLESNPVSTIAAATTIAGTLGIQRIYLVNDSSITLAQGYEGWDIRGLGLGNVVDLGGQDVDNACFGFMTVTGTQGGTGLVWMRDCGLTALVALQCIADRCYLTGNNTLRASSMTIFDQCKSAVAGNATPELTFTGLITNLNFRHYSGGLQLNGMGTGDTMSYESDGQIIVDATCTDGDLTVRGDCDITDNASGAVAITQTAAINRANIEAACTTSIELAKLDHLVAAAEGGAVVDDSIMAKLAAKGVTATWSDYSNVTDSLQGSRDTMVGDHIVLRGEHALLATAANLTTLMNRVGAFTGSGVNTILGFFLALLKSDATDPSDVGGTFLAATDSTQAIRDRGDAAWTTGAGGGSGDVILGPIVAVKDPGNRIGDPIPIEMFQSAEKAFAFTPLDADGDPVDMSAMTLRFMVNDSNRPPNSKFKVDEGANLVVSGDNNEIATVTVTSTQSATSTLRDEWPWTLRDTVTEQVILHGTLVIKPSLADVP